MDNKNLPAYPTPFLTGQGLPEAMGPFDGLTKREYFAAMAMQGMVTHTGTYGLGNDPGSMATRAVECADALLVELGKEN